MSEPANRIDPRPTPSAAPAALIALFAAAAVAIPLWAAASLRSGGFDERWLLGPTDERRGFGGAVVWMLETTRGELRRPLFWAAAAIERSLAGDAAAAAVHAGSLALHAALVAVAAFVAGRWYLRTGADGKAKTGTLVVALAAALPWALHPARIEAVADASAQGTLVGTLLACASAAIWSRGVASASRPVASAVGSAALLGLALLADPTLCFAPIAFVALAMWLRRDAPEQRMSTSAFLTILCVPAALALVASLAVRETGAGPPVLVSALAAASRIVRPLRATLWPLGLHPAYDPPAGFPDEIAPSLWIDALTAAGLVVACIAGVRRRAGWGLALLAYLGLALGPVLLRRSPAGSDVDGYAATIPLFVAAGVAATQLPGVLRWAAAAAGVAVTVLFGVTARREIESWTDEAALARHVADIDPCNERASVAMGDEARRAGAPVADLVQWYGAVLESGDWRPLAHARLGATLLETGDAVGAREHLERAVAIAPWLAAARFDLGALELREGNLDAARVQLDTAARLDAESADAWRVLAQVRDRSGDRDGAADAIRRAARLRPDDAGIAEDLRRLAK